MDNLFMKNQIQKKDASIDKKNKNLCQNFFYYEKLYMAGKHFSIQDLSLIEHGGHPGSRTFLLVLPAGPVDVLEIYHADTRQLLPLSFREKTYVIGIARGYRKTLRLLEQIFLEHMDKAGALRSYFNQARYVRLEDLVL